MGSFDLILDLAFSFLDSWRVCFGLDLMDEFELGGLWLHHLGM